MNIELREPELAGPPIEIDWMAEFVDEEKQDLPLLLGLDAHDDHKQVEHVPEARLIPLPTVEPPAAWVPPPHRPLPAYGGLGLSLPALVLVGVAAIAALIGAAVLWSGTTRMVDQTVLLSRAPATAPAPIEPSTPPPATKLIRAADVSVPQVAALKVSSKSPVSTKPRPTAAPVSSRPARTEPPRAAASALPPLVQGAIDRKRLEASEPPEASPTSTPTPPPIPTPTPASLVIAPPTATSIAAASVTTLGAPPTPKPAANPAPPPPARDERAIQTAAIQTVLDRYRLAFSTLSTDGVATVWRTVDTRALSRAFDQLEKQTVDFDSCQIEIAGAMANASCRGRTSFVPKIGARTPRVEARQWTFRLVHLRSGWVIDRVETR